MYDSKGKKIKIPTFLDDDEHFIDDDDDDFSSLMPSGCSKNQSIPVIDFSKKDDWSFIKLIKTLKSDKFQLSSKLEKFKDLETIQNDSPRSLS